MRTLGIFKNGKLVARVSGSVTECYAQARRMYRSFEYSLRWVNEQS